MIDFLSEEQHCKCMPDSSDGVDDIDEAIELLEEGDFDGFHLQTLKDEGGGEFYTGFEYGYDTDADRASSEMSELMIASILLTLSNDVDKPVDEIAAIGVERAQEILQK